MCTQRLPPATPCSSTASSADLDQAPGRLHGSGTDIRETLICARNLNCRNFRTTVFPAICCLTLHYETLSACLGDTEQAPFYKYITSELDILRCTRPWTIQASQGKAKESKIRYEKAGIAG